MAFKFEIEKKIAPLSEPKADGMQLEVNRVSFNDRKAKIDIRPWDSTHEKMGKGIALTDDEAKVLRDTLLEEFPLEG